MGGRQWYKGQDLYPEQTRRHQKGWKPAVNCCLFLFLHQISKVSESSENGSGWKHFPAVSTTGSEYNAGGGGVSEVCEVKAAVMQSECVQAAVKEYIYCT